MDEAHFMHRAIEISGEALSRPGTMPFGAVIVRDGTIVGEGLNHSAAHHDPTSHGEVEAIRDACRRLETTDLTGCELYTSCEPCSLCVAAMYLAGIARFHYAASLDDYAAVFDEARRGTAIAEVPAIDTDDLRLQIGRKVHDRSMPVAQLMAPEAKTILAAWLKEQAPGR